MKTNPPMESFQLPSVAIEKWKQGHENQGNVPRNLIALLAASRAPSTPQNQHPPRISLDLVPIFKLLLVVSQHSILLPNDSNASTLLLRTSPPGTTVVSGIKGPAMYNSSPVPLKSIIKNVGGLVGRVENGHSLKRTHELKRVTFNDFTLNPEKRQRTLFPSSITSSFASSSSSSSSFSSSKLTFSRSSSHSFSASSSSNSISPSYHHMILSACTKYDHDSVYFARDEKDLYKGLIVQEVFEDGYADQDVAGTFNERTAEFAVGLYVEQRFAKWKKV
ncbi:hypothetical protein BCR33DRAFT_721855 [Rhizoclosmatium globosum]|uniref:Uncharacterized protein n=1 Tax=Rhizoclosmatium globosum TaxID=329046 RepID=A0A1Y2BPG5_9FUNG|nr:hypothetical protein BCR33DRAFT_721855 [Rhizoclosmatium globosum]|eukprot:ORY36626.1 hypothetical protein BCR33DRAFT_721855 [Rhizoclosmatium globosum]